MPGPDMRVYMEGLIDQELLTPVERQPNWIRGIEGSRVRVATRGNREGALVSISLVQETVDRIFDGDEVAFHPNNRSAFLGAVLETMDEVEVLTDPRRARLASGTARRNPPWEYDELVLALDVYFREPRARQSKTHPAVADLSRVLRALPLPIARPNPERFRNVNGAFMKLQNFKAVDPEYTAGGRTGLGAGATARERTLFERYAEDREALQALAQEIRRRIAEGGDELPTTPVEDEEGVVEGRVLYRVHKTRERSRSDAKKRSIFAKTGQLACEVCAFDFEQAYGELGRGFAECHHKLPLSTGERTTYLRDLAIVCANCHRMLHQDDVMTVEALRALRQ